ncbi:hypothetical protein, unlikely [Trypanosoma brucei gambiense DAL972]|uniref:Uncharacterized protein n=1 Tax=Trypanosoma brucei gambiense (strain MHOM/CI/86/DAL972) TaxID=679716 RepID=D0A7T8_TRYB9|nr:hypothetical protein, unlikely [Trypanosoma brucei gambiense DAL972]CBH17739.1 hypothetical protein, unlikely [Trypanosoma brucei gambiense DAL972]|eukprot:XP_011780003.1 hypothetical protein, unlikely [Trypanosoma brucei gambiense DAL972]
MCACTYSYPRAAHGHDGTTSQLFTRKRIFTLPQLHRSYFLKLLFVQKPLSNPLRAVSLHLTFHQHHSLLGPSVACRAHKHMINYYAKCRARNHTEGEGRCLAFRGMYLLTRTGAFLPASLAKKRINKLHW